MTNRGVPSEPHPSEPRPSGPAARVSTAPLTPPSEAPSVGERPVAVLVGPPGAGKSTVAAALARRLGVPTRDTDADIAHAAGKSISDIFVEDGEPAFRALERTAVAAALREHRGVLALGGGAVLDEQTRTLLADYSHAGGLVVFLDVSLSAAAPRVGFNQSRPLLAGNPRARWAELMAVRRPVYEAVCDISVVTDGLTPAVVAERIGEAIAGRTPTAHTEGE